MTNRTCSIDGCERTAGTRGWCRAHYDRWLNHGDTGPATIAPRGPAPSGDCSETECSKPAVKRGWCTAHYQQWRTTGELRPLRPWRLEVVTCISAHQRLWADRGPASEYLCVDCGRRAHDWSYDYSDPNELTDPSLGGRPYSLDQDRYQPRCVPCHRRFDANAPVPMPQRVPAWDDE